VAGHLRLRPRALRIARSPRSRHYLDTAAPEPLFVLSAIAQYTGATIAVLLFDEVAPRTVAWLRVAGAAAVLILVSPGALRRWTRLQLAAAAVFGIATALMNTFFFMGLARTDLGKSVAIEFIGPIAVAAAMTRTGRNGVALVFAAAGVVVLGGVEIGDNTVGLLWILAASAMWAVYIVIGSRVAQIGRGVAGLGIGLAIGAVVITPIGAPGSGEVFTTPRLLAGCVLVGIFSNAIGYGIDQHVLRRIPIRRFSVLLALLPVTAVVFGWIGLDQVPSTVEFAGIALVLAGVVLQERDELPTPAEADAP
jgi:inner membrane transporter RhtA